MKIFIKIASNKKTTVIIFWQFVSYYFYDPLSNLVNNTTNISTCDKTIQYTYF